MGLSQLARILVMILYSTLKRLIGLKSLGISGGCVLGIRVISVWLRVGGGEDVVVKEGQNEVNALVFKNVPEFLVEHGWEAVWSRRLFGVHVMEGIFNFFV